MRVAVVIERLADRGGGVEAAAYELLRELARREIDVTVVCRARLAPAPDGVRVIEVGAPRAWQPMRVATFSHRAASATRSGFDLVHTYSRTRWQDVYRAGGGSHAEYMDRVYRTPRLQQLLSPRHRVLLGIEEAVFADPRQIVQCISRRDADEIGRRYGVPESRLVTIYNGVDGEHFHPRNREHHRESIRAELRLDGPVALFVGHAFHRKGLDRAISGLARSGVDADLLVAGTDRPGRYAGLARRLGVEDRVHFLGARRDIQALHTAADLFLFPSRYDPFGCAALEAMASGLPVVCAPSTGAAELVKPDVNGSICDQDWGPAFQLLRDPVQLARMAEAARATAEVYTWPRHADTVLELYERVLASR